MTKEELKQIYYINREIKMWQKELDKLECRSLAKGQVITGMPFNTGTSDPTFEIVAEKDRYRKVIDGLLARLQIERSRIIEYIEGIDDSLVRQIIFLRSVSCMSWNQVANEIGGTNTEDGVRKIYDRYLSKR